jgi:hypothetical protein
VEPADRRIHGAAAHCEGDDAHRHVQLVGERCHLPDDADTLGRGREPDGDAADAVFGAPAVAARTDGQRHRRRVQQSIAGRAHHHLAVVAVGGRTEHEELR